MDKFLLREYHTMEILSLPIKEGLEYYFSAFTLREEERLHSLWVAIHTDRRYKAGTYTDFRESVMSGKKKSAVNTGRKMGSIKGADLSQAG